MVLACCVRKRVWHDVAEFADLELEGAYLTARAYENVVTIETAQGIYAGWSELGELDVEYLFNWLGEWLDAQEVKHEHPV